MRPTRVLITAGPTRAYLDRVRYLSNFSSGATAYEIAKHLLKNKNTVAVVAGPTRQPFTKLRLAYYPVETTDEMRQKVLKLCRKFQPDVVIFAAAVLDFSPVSIAAGKVSSQRKNWVIRLRPTPKILVEVQKKFPNIRRIGFKLEWKKPTNTDSFSRNYLNRNKLEVLCVNFLPEIKGSQHPFRVYFSNGKKLQVGTKAALGRSLSAYLSKNPGI